MPKPDPTRRPLQSVPEPLRSGLDSSQRREVADLGGTLQRRQRDRALGRGSVPPFLDGAEAEAPGAARLWMRLDATGPAPVATLADVGRVVGLDPAGTSDAVGALRRAELVIDGPRGLAAVTPGGVPF